MKCTPFLLLTLVASLAGCSGDKHNPKPGSPAAAATAASKKPHRPGSRPPHKPKETPLQSVEKTVLCEAHFTDLNDLGPAAPMPGQASTKEARIGGRDSNREIEIFRDENYKAVLLSHEGHVRLSLAQI